MEQVDEICICRQKSTRASFSTPSQIKVFIIPSSLNERSCVERWRAIAPIVICPNVVLALEEPKPSNKVLNTNS